MKSPTESTAMITPPTRSILASLLGRLSLAAGILFGIGLVFYIGLVAWIHHSISGQAISITQAAGLPSDAEHAFRGLLPVLLAVTLLRLLVKLVIECFNPFRSTDAIVGRLALLIALSYGVMLVPHGLRIIRGVDHAGLPTHMLPSDPAAARWWNPDGDPVLFHSTEDDGSVRFWNRPGITPDSGVDSFPVTRESRIAWQRALQEAAARKKAETSRIEDERRRIIAAADAQTQRENAKQAERAAADAAATRERREAESITAAARAKADADAKVETVRRQAEADKARAARLADEKEALRRELSAALEAKRQATVAEAERDAANNGRVAENDRSGPSGWHTVTLLPGRYFQVHGGEPNSRIEIRSNGRGAFQAPTGGPPLQFGGGHASFYTPAPHFRLHCRESSSFRVSYRWIPQ